MSTFNGLTIDYDTNDKTGWYNSIGRTMHIEYISASAIDDLLYCIILYSR